MKKFLSLLTVGFALSFGTAHAASHAGAAPMAGNPACDAKAAEKKLSGAAKTSFLKKCVADSAAAPSAACEKSAADKKLSGAAKTSHLKKCMADAKMADSAMAKPAASAKK